MFRGGVHLISIYLFDSEGLSDRNRALLQQHAAAVRTLRGPWNIGGGRNLTLQALAESGIVGVLEDAWFRPHWPSRLALRSDARRTLVPKLVRPPRIPGALPAGPHAPAPAYRTCDGSAQLVDIRTACAIGRRTNAWSSRPSLNSRRAHLFRTCGGNLPSVAARRHTLAPRRCPPTGVSSRPA